MAFGTLVRVSFVLAVSLGGTVGLFSWGPTIEIGLAIEFVIGLVCGLAGGLRLLPLTWLCTLAAYPIALWLALFAFLGENWWLAALLTLISDTFGFLAGMALRRRLLPPTSHALS